jgi:hypothetical protein
MTEEPEDKTPYHIQTPLEFFDYYSGLIRQSLNFFISQQRRENETKKILNSFSQQRKQIETKKNPKQIK